MNDIADDAKLNVTFSVKLSSEDIASLDEVLLEERRRERVGTITRRDLVRLAIRQFIEQRLNRVARRTY